LLPNHQNLCPKCT